MILYDSPPGLLFHQTARRPRRLGAPSSDHCSLPLVATGYAPGIGDHRRFRVGILRVFVRGQLSAPGGEILRQRLSQTACRYDRYGAVRV